MMMGARRRFIDLALLNTENKIRQQNFTLMLKLSKDFITPRFWEESGKGYLAA